MPFTSELAERKNMTHPASSDIEARGGWEGGEDEAERRERGIEKEGSTKHVLPRVWSVGTGRNVQHMRAVHHRPQPLKLGLGRRALIQTGPRLYRRCQSSQDVFLQVEASIPAASKARLYSSCQRLTDIGLRLVCSDYQGVVYLILIL